MGQVRARFGMLGFRQQRKPPQENRKEMANRKPNKQQARDEVPRHYPPAKQAPDALAMFTLAGVVATLVISFSNWREIDRIQTSLDGKLGQIDSGLAQLAQKVDDMPSKAAPAQPARRGPDPNRVYQIKTAGAPARGPASAAVTIAEFSDFQ